MISGSVSIVYTTYKFPFQSATYFLVLYLKQNYIHFYCLLVLVPVTYQLV